MIIGLWHSRDRENHKRNCEKNHGKQENHEKRESIWLPAVVDRRESIAYFQRIDDSNGPLN